MKGPPLQQVHKYCFISYAQESLQCPIHQRKIIHDCLNKIKGKKKKKRPFYIMGHEKIPPRDAHHISWPENFLERANHPAFDVIFLFNDKSYFSINEVKNIYTQSGLTQHQTILIIVQEMPIESSISA